LLDLISGLGEVPSASPSWGLWQLSRAANASSQVTALFDRGPSAVLEALQGGDETIAAFRNQFDQFLADYGQRGPNEWDIRAISWEAGPEQALALVDSMRQMPDENSPDSRHDKLAANRAMTALRIRNALAGDEARQQHLRRRVAVRGPHDPVTRADEARRRHHDQRGADGDA
jgi:pyruvate,water dikinase